MDLTVYCLITLLCIFIDNIMPYLNIPILPIILFINFSSLYLLITRINISIRISYDNTTP